MAGTQVIPTIRPVGKLKASGARGTRFQEASTNLGLAISEMREMFLASRRRGTEGARTQCRERTVDNYVTDLEHLMYFFERRKYTHWGQVQREDIARFIDWVQDGKPKFEGRKPWSKGTQLKVLRSLRAFLYWIEASEACQDSGARSHTKTLPVIARNASRTTVPTIEEMYRLKNSLPVQTIWGYRDYVVMSLLLDCGVRIGEVGFLELKDLKLEQRTILVPEEGKTGHRIVRIHPEMVKLLSAWLDVRKQYAKANVKAVFINRHGEASDGFMFTQSFRKYSQRAGLTHITPHTFRHFFCTQWIRGGGDLVKLQSQTGHRQLSTLQGYLHIAGGEEVAAEQERVSPLIQVMGYRPDRVRRAKSNRL